MCLVCDELIISPHWTNVWSGRGDRDTGLAQHHAQLRLLRLVLNHFRLTVDLELGGSAYVVGDGKGSRIVCRDIDSVWGACGNIAGFALDPLDRSLIQVLESEMRTGSSVLGASRCETRGRCERA